MRIVTLTVGKPTATQQAEAYRSACSYPVPNRAKSTTATVKVGKRNETVARTIAVRFAILLAIATGESVELTDLFTVAGADYASNRAELYHLAHRAVSAVENDHGYRMEVTALLAGTVTRKGRKVTGVASTRGEVEAVFIQPK